MPIVSVCLLTYNRGSKLTDTINSILLQSFRDFELIINDDSSTDSTEIICNDFALKDKRIKYFKNKKNLRFADNQNAAILRSSCEYIAILHDGDVYDSHLIEKWYNCLKNNNKSALVFCGYKSNSFSLQTLWPLAENNNGYKVSDLLFSLGQSPIWGIVMLRRSFLLETGPFDRRFSTLADVDMWFRLMLNYDVSYVAEYLVTISPREKHHINNAGNWKIHKEVDEIFWINSIRAYKNDTFKFNILNKHLEYIIWTKNIYSLLWCIKSFKVINLIKGITHCITHKKRKAQAFRNDLNIKLIWPDI